MRVDNGSPEFMINNVGPEINILMDPDPDEERKLAYQPNDNFLESNQFSQNSFVTSSDSSSDSSSDNETMNDCMNPRNTVYSSVVVRG